MSGKSFRVLHVDDEPDFADLAATYLQREDDSLSVETAISAEEALDRLADDDFDCVVSDYDMPRTNGIEFLERVREAYPDLPFILFTGKGSEEVASDAISAGVTDYLQKQGDTSQYELLANRIHNAVEGFRAERRARVQERQYRELFESAPIMYALATDEDGRPIVADCNDRLVAKLGYDRQEIIGRPMTDFYTEESARAVYEHGDYERALSGEFDREDRTLVAKDGERIETILRASPRLDEQGDTIGLQLLYLDVTERRERARRLELAIQQTRSGVWEYDLATGMVTRYEGASNLWDTDAHTTVPMEEAITERVHPEDRATVRNALDATVDEGKPYHVEFRHTTPDGYRWAEARGELVREDDSDHGRLIACTTDTHAYKERERELEWYETTVEASGDAVYTLDTEGHLTFVNDAFCELVGYTGDELLGEYVSLVMDEADIERSEGVIRELLTSEREHETVTMELIRADGERVPCETHIALLSDDDGEFRGTTGIHRDITDRKERETELELYETMLETVPDGVYALDEDLQFLAVNRGLADMIGYSQEALIGSHLSMINTEGGVETARRNREQLLKDDGSVDDAIRVLEHVLITADGEEISCEARFRALPSDGDSSFRGTAGVVRDITERTERERELQRQNERLEEFASVISHDLRNPLNVAGGRLALAQEECDSEHLADVERALDRMDVLIDDILTVAREGTALDATEPIDLAAVVDACWHNVETADATLAVDTERTIQADRSRFQQLLENLVRNAVEHGGTDVTITVGDLPDGTGFYLEDDGSGVPEDEREQVFESGYSTTEEGTGFGLAIVREIAQAHGWNISLTESAGGGTRFEITGVDLDA